MDIIPATSSKNSTKDTNFGNYLIIVYGMEIITTEEVIDKLYMFQARFGKVGEFGWWDMGISQNCSGVQFTSKEFQELLFVCGLQL